MDPKLLAMLMSLGHVLTVDSPGGEGGSPTPPASDDPAPAGAEQRQGDPAEHLGEGGKKALDAERKRAAEAEKQAKALQAQLDALNDSKLTETQRLQKQFEELTSQYQASQIEATRNRVIAAEQIPSSLAGFVSGDDEAAMVASAQALKTALAEASKPGTPVPDPSQGAHPPVDAVAHSAPGSARLAAAFEQQLSTRSK